MSLMACAASVALVLFAGRAAWGVQPNITQVIPPGGQRGSEVELAIAGKRLDDAAEIQWYDSGITVKSLDFSHGTDAKDGKVKAKIEIAADCPLGEHAFRLRTDTGLSELRTFWVGVLPSVMEKEPNNDIEHAQKIDLNVTVTGVIAGEDVDCFAVEAKKGQRLVAVVEGMRLGRTLFDPRLALLDSTGRELAVCDGHPLVRQDSLVAIEAPADGTYYIQLRDTSYGGNENCNYRLHVGTFPQPTAVLPLGGKPGEEVEFHFLGDVKGQFTRKIKLPEHVEPEFWLFPEDGDGTAAAGIPVRVVDLPNVVSDGSHTSLKDAMPVDLPAAVNGVIAKPGQQELYLFSAKKGQTLEINCYARRLRSPLDSVIQIFHGGKPIANNDDANGPDSYLRFQVPDDGEYALGVRDQLGRGGPTFTYRVEIAPPAPSMEVNIPKVQQFSQDRQTIVVARGNRYAARVGVDRHEFGGGVIVAASDLPAGVSADEQTIPAAVNSTPMVFEADDDALCAGTLATLAGRMADPKNSLTGDYRQTVELVIGDNQSVFWTRNLQKLAVVVTDEAPFTLEIVEPKVPLVQNGSHAIEGGGTPRSAIQSADYAGDDRKRPGSFGRFERDDSRGAIGGHVSAECQRQPRVWQMENGGDGQDDGGRGSDLGLVAVGHAGSCASVCAICDESHGGGTGPDGGDCLQDRSQDAIRRDRQSAFVWIAEQGDSARSGIHQRHGGIDIPSGDRFAKPAGQAARHWLPGGDHRARRTNLPKCGSERNCGLIPRRRQRRKRRLTARRRMRKRPGRREEPTE